MIRTLTAAGVLSIALGAASCARNERDGSHAEHTGHEPAGAVAPERPAAPAPVTVEPAREAAAPAVDAGQDVVEKPKPKRKATARPAPPAPVSAPERQPEPEPEPAPTPKPASQHAGHDSDHHHHH